ncbi:hypothetical protein QE379_003747 [Sphingomonas sp. SORGH_AS 879]|nr:hypothetical protein [Sphingomonas sp. SORGH_AS_0879]
MAGPPRPPRDPLRADPQNTDQRHDESFLFHIAA